MNNQLLLIILALSAGMMIPFQSAMNARLGKELQSPYYAALAVFIIAAAGLMAYIMISRYSFPPAQKFTAAPVWSYLGGILGGTYISIIVICAPKLGIGNVTIMVLLGQILAAILIDQFGLLHSAVHTLNWQRAIGLLLVMAGVYLVKKF